MKIDNIDNIANKEKSPDKAERSASIEEIKKTQKFFDFNDLSNAAAINSSLPIPEKDTIIFDYLSPGSSKLKKLLLNSDPEVVNFNTSNEKVHNNSEYLNNNNNSNSNNISVNTTTTTTTNNNISSSSNIHNSIANKNKINNLAKPKYELNAINSNKKTEENEERKSAKNLNKQKLFWCSECNEYFLKLNLFNHMKSVHNKFTCLYCYGFFVKIESLERHLVKKHKVQNTSFFDEQTLRNYFSAKESNETAPSSKVIKAVCCKCATIFTINENNFHTHCCGNEKITSSLPVKETTTARTPKTVAATEVGVQKNYPIEHDVDAAVLINSNRNDTLETSSSSQQQQQQHKLKTDSTKDDIYCEKAIQKWLQPNVTKTTFNGGKFK